MDFERQLHIPMRSFFLLGPRGVGKSFWLRRSLSAKVSIDLLDTALQLELTRNPNQLESLIADAGRNDWVWIDEVQKIPALLDEVHRLIENRQLRFALSGSSARKLFRGGANLLGGRASTRYLEALTWSELSPSSPVLANLIAWGTLPLVVREPDAAADILSAYVHTYIREEIREEGLVRKLDPFLRFIDVAGQLNGQELNVEAVARDARVPRRSVDGFFEILEDTLMAYRLPAYKASAKVREVSHPKFYWFDPGVARAAARRLATGVDPLWAGAAFETLVYHELRVQNRLRVAALPLAYYRTGAGSEIDFIVELERKTFKAPARIVSVEAKYATRWDASWVKPMLDLASSQNVRLERMVVVYCGQRRLKHHGVDVLPFEEFIAELGDGRIIPNDD